MNIFGKESDVLLMQSDSLMISHAVEAMKIFSNFFSSPKKSHKRRKFINRVA